MGGHVAGSTGCARDSSKCAVRLPTAAAIEQFRLNMQHLLGLDQPTPDAPPVYPASPSAQAALRFRNGDTTALGLFTALGAAAPPAARYHP